MGNGRPAEGKGDPVTVQEQFTPPGAAGLGEFTAAWRAWHARHEARLADPPGFLAITSLHWLTATPQRRRCAPATASCPPPACTGAPRRPSGSATPRAPGTPARTA